MDTALLAGRAKPSVVLLGLAVAFAAVWCLLPLLLTTTVGRDTVQILYWGREWQLGYFKHPPLIAWLSEFVALGFGRSDLVSFATSVLVMLAAFAMVHALARRYLDGWGAVMAVAALPTIGYYSYLVPHFNHNTLLLLFWSAALLLGYKVMVEERRRYWPVLGLVLGLGILTKYTVLLVPGAFLVMVLSSRYFRSAMAAPGAWVGAGVCFAVTTPHVVWLAGVDWAPLRYMMGGAGMGEEVAWSDHVLGPVAGVLLIIGMAASGLAHLLIALGRPDGFAFKGLSSADTYLLHVFFGPMVLVLCLSALTGGALRSEWASPFLLLMPLAVLRFAYAGRPLVVSMSRFLWTGFGFALAMSITYAIIVLGFVAQADEARWNRFPARHLADEVGAAWGRQCQGPVPLVIGDAWLAGTAAHKLAERPRVYTEADARTDPWLSDQAVRASGAVVVWNTDLSGRYRDIDHQDPAPPGVNPDWLSGPEELEARFGPLAQIQSLELNYPGPVHQAPVKVTLAVIRPEAGCSP